jgi:hypothetical protein
MYYVIFDAATDPKDLERLQTIKQQLAEQGLIGEMVTPQPGRDIAMLVENGMQKRYATVILVGGSNLVNEACRLLIHHDVVVGIVPLRQERDLLHLLGVSSTQEAIAILKRRRWHSHAIGMLDTGEVFVTDLTLHSDQQTTATITTPDFSAVATLVREVIVSPGASELTVSIIGDAPQKKGGWWRKSSTSAAPHHSQITVTACTIEAPDLLTGHVAGELMGSAPYTCTISQQQLRLIANRHSLTTDSEAGTV